ncbi:L-rhamnono-gamma-lactonase [Penicillium rolfsii]|nr:L-rhamnono-gamma-lactonase [Penicillium rolfsii]
MPTPIVDSHIHLFPASHLPTLAWYSPDSPLGSQHSVDEYRHASSSVSTQSDTAESKYLRGFIFLETDRISSVADDEPNSPGWTHALDEVSFLTRIALGKPVSGEGHDATHKDLCLGIIPWAPVPGGPEALSSYMAKVKERTQMDEVWHKVRGVRYLVQDKPAGVMLQSQFVEGLRWLGEQGLAFDLGVDARSGGLHQLHEAVEMMDRLGDAGVTIIINHLCKPNLRLSPDTVLSHPEFLEWKELVTKMAQLSSRNFMKLSGAFSELPPLESESEPDISNLIDRIQPWTDVVFDAFGAERVMFGSDWPVCNVGGGGNDVSWSRWINVVEGILERRGLSEEQKQGVWGQVAVKAYGVSI